MKFIRISIIAMALICALTIFVSATDVKASYYIDKWEVDATLTDKGNIAIKISVDGTGRMTALGGKEIIIYEKINNRWMIADYFDRDDPGMVGTNTNTFVNTIYTNAYPNTEYKICVTIFAEDSSGDDSRYQEIYINT